MGPEFQSGMMKMFQRSMVVMQSSVSVLPATDCTHKNGENGNVYIIHILPQ